MTDERLIRPAVRRRAVLAAAAEKLAHLPPGFDDLSSEMGLKVYQEMRRDPAVSAAFEVLKGVILNTTFKVERKSKPRSEEMAQMLADFCDAALSEAEVPLPLVLDEALDALAIGAQPCEIIWRVGSWEGQLRLMIQSIEAKPREDVGLVVDEFGRLVGYTARKDGGLSVQVGSVDEAELLPLEKFFCLREKASVIRPAFNAFHLKTKVIPELFRQLVNFAQGKYVGFMPEDSNTPSTIPNEPGSQEALQTPEQQMLETLAGLSGGEAAVFAAGSQVIIDHGDAAAGRAFIEALDWCDKQAAMGVLALAQAMVEAQHSSKASSETAFQGLIMLNQRRREKLANEITRQILRPLVRLNFGEEALVDAPVMAVERDVMAERAFLMDAVARLFASGFIHSSQQARLDSDLGLPERDLEAESLEAADDESALQQLEAELAKLRGEA
jgi:hypothetical protein